MKPIMLALATLLLSSGAAAQNTSMSSSSTPAPTAAADARDTVQTQSGGEGQERRVCRRLDTTGSRNARPTCMTVRQWRQFDRR